MLTGGEMFFSKNEDDSRKGGRKGKEGSSSIKKGDLLCIRNESNGIQISDLTRLRERKGRKGTYDVKPGKECSQPASEARGPVNPISPFTRGKRGGKVFTEYCWRRLAHKRLKSVGFFPGGKKRKKKDKGTASEFRQAQDEARSSNSEGKQAACRESV